MDNEVPRKAPVSILVRGPSEAEEPESPPVLQVASPSVDGPPNEATARLRAATLLFGVSLLFRWGEAYWWAWYVHVVWDPGYLEPVATVSGWQEVLWYLETMFLETWMVDQYRYMLMESGPFPLLFIVMRHLMPFALAATLVFAWVKHDQLHAVLEKVGTFTAAYAVVVGLVMLNILNVGVWTYGPDVAMEMFWGSIGFWGAILTGLVLHPRLVPLPNWAVLNDGLVPREYTTMPPKGMEFTSDGKPTHAPSLGAMVLYYLPFLYLYSVVISVNRGGDDDALFLGTVLPLVGFFVGLFQFRLDFFKGFLKNLLFCVPMAFAFGLAGFIGVFGEPDGIENILLLVILPNLYLPRKHHVAKDHARALGAAHAAPLGTLVVMMGLVIGVIMRYGF